MRTIAFVIACAVLGWATPAAAQGLGTSRVAAVTATIYARCDPASPARAVLERGAAVTIEAVNEGWVLGQRRRRRAGLHAAQRARADPGHRSRRRGASGPRGRPRARHPAAEQLGRPIIAERAIVSINASYLTASRTFDDTRTFDLYAEQGSFTTDYDVEASVGVDAGAFVRVWQDLAAAWRSRRTRTMATS